MKIFSVLSQISISKLFNPAYIFESVPTSDGLYIYLLVIFGLEVAAAIILSILKSKMDKIYFRLENRSFNLLLTTGIIGIFLVLMRFEQIPFFGSRLMFLILILAFIIWGLWIAYYWIFQIPKEKLAEKKKQKFIKYLPRQARVMAGLPQASKRKI